MFSVTLKQLIEEFKLEDLTHNNNHEEILITTTEVNRPGLQLTGFFDYFGTDRIQIIGKVEITYLESLTYEERYNKLDAFFNHGFPCLVVSRELPVFPEMIEIAKKYNIPVLRNKDVTSRFMSALIGYLNLELAPRITRHGGLVEVYGEGILILGESGVGKSEIALELVKRGHRMVADDVVEIKKVSEITLVGTSPEIIRHLVEVRGIGIMDVKYLFGVGSVKPTEKIDLVINLELWNDKKHYDRLGLTDEYTEILGIAIPSLTIPVSPGRNLAIIVEVAAMNNRLKKLGYNAAKELNKRVLGEISKDQEDQPE